MKQIIIDTSMLIAAAQFRADIFSEISRICLFNYHLCIIDRTIDELNRIYEGQKGRHKAAAKLALALLKPQKIMVIDTRKIDSGYVDRLILETAKKGESVVATQDIVLKRKLKEKGIQVITLRQKKHLVWG